MGIKDNNFEVGEEEIKSLEKAMKKSDKKIIDEAEDKKVRENFYVNKKAMAKIKKYVLLQKLEGETISKSSLVNKWICENVKKLDI